MEEAGTTLEAEAGLRWALVGVRQLDLCPWSPAGGWSVGQAGEGRGGDKIFLGE